MLGAYAGAVLDILGTVSSLAAQNKDKGFIKRHTKLTVILINALILAAGIAVMILTKDKFGLFSIAGVLLHTSAFWISDEKIIRRVSFIGSPFWLVYNIASQAYGSAIGDVLTMISIAVAIFRYDIRGAKTKKE